MNIFKSMASVVLLIFGISAHGSQTFTVQIDNAGPFVAGSTNNVMSVWAFTSLPNNPPLNLHQFSLGFDFGASGVGTTGFSNISVVQNTSVFSTTTGPIFDSNRTNYDFRVSGTALSTSSLVMTDFTSSNRLKLFDLKFDINSTTAGGSYNFKFVPTLTSTGIPNQRNLLTGGLNAGSNIFTNWVASGNSFVASGGEFDVQGIPEPSTIALLALGLGSGAAYRRFRKRSPTQGSGTAGS